MIPYIDYIYIITTYCWLKNVCTLILFGRNRWSTFYMEIGLNDTFWGRAVSRKLGRYYIAYYVSYQFILKMFEKSYSAEHFIKYMYSTLLYLVSARWHHNGSTGCGVLKRGTQNKKDFCIKINIPKENYWILRIGLMGSLSSLQNSEFLKLITLIFYAKKLTN